MTRGSYPDALLPTSVETTCTFARLRVDLLLEPESGSAAVWVYAGVDRTQPANPNGRPVASHLAAVDYHVGCRQIACRPGRERP